MPLRYRDSGRSPNYLDAKEVVELLHVRHLEFVREEEFDLVDVERWSTPMTRSSTYRMMTIGLSESLCMYKELSDFDLWKLIR